MLIKIILPCTLYWFKAVCFSLDKMYFSYCVHSKLSKQQLFLADWFYEFSYYVQYKNFFTAILRNKGTYSA